MNSLFGFQAFISPQMSGLIMHPYDRRTEAFRIPRTAVSIQGEVSEANTLAYWLVVNTAERSVVWLDGDIPIEDLSA